MANPEKPESLGGFMLCIVGGFKRQARQALKTHDINDILKTTKDMNPSFRKDYAQCILYI